MRQWLFITVIIVLLAALWWQPDDRFSLFDVTRRTYSEDTNGFHAELLDLKAELVKREALRDALEGPGGKGLPAFVYSRYPFGERNTLVIDKGRLSGVESGQAATLHNVLVGRVREVSPRSATVETLFDPKFKLAVRVGPDGVDALLVGGNEPKVTLMAKDANIDAGDIVISAEKELSYGIAIGTIAEIMISSDNLFKEATLEVPYRPSRIHLLLIHMR